MVVIESVELPDGTIYVAMRTTSHTLLFEQDKETGDYKPVTTPVFGSWSSEDV